MLYTVWMGIAWQEPGDHDHEHTQYQDRERTQEKANKSKGTVYISCVDQVPATRYQETSEP
jgi:hypothetical protein